jgi:hypothetical protein
VHDAANATVRYNIFGPKIIVGSAYLNATRWPVAQARSHKRLGHADRPDTGNGDVPGNTLDGEIVKGCDLNTTVKCAANKPR